MNNEKLKHCPFCGERDFIGVHPRRERGEILNMKGWRFWTVECYDCDASTSEFFDADYKDGNGKQRAIDAWNRRVEDE